MMDLTIQEIARACGGTLVVQGGKADGDTRVSSVVIDSRLVEPQGVFIATAGERVDGHRFIPAAFARGAVLAVTQKRPEEVAEAGGEGASRPSGEALEAAQLEGASRTGAEAPADPAGTWGCYVLVEDTLQALKDIAEAYRKKLSVKVIGITGSVGKTSTKEFIAAVLAEKYSVLKTEGNFNNEIGVPLTLLRIRGEHELAVVEMGISDFGEMHRLSKMARPDVCVMTNIGQSHLNNLKDRDGILRAKSEIFDYMAEDGEICLNGEDDKLSALREIGGHKPHFFGLGSSPVQEVAAVDIRGKGLWGSDATLVMAPAGTAREDREQDGMPDMDCAEIVAAALEGDWPGYRRLAVHVPQPGRHMVLNAAAAACVAGLFGLSDGQIAAGIGKVASVSGRTNIISTPHYTIIDDCYNANPASVKAAIDLLAMADTRKVAILGDMLNLGENSHAYHAEIGSYAAEAGIDCIYCVGEESRYMYEAACGGLSGVPGPEAGLSGMPDAEAGLSAAPGPKAGLSGVPDGEVRLSGVSCAEERLSGVLCPEASASDVPNLEASLSGVPNPEATASAHPLAPSPRHVLHYPDRNALLRALAAEREELLPEGGTILIKASHDCGFADILAYLQELD